MDSAGTNRKRASKGLQRWAKLIEKSKENKEFSRILRHIKADPPRRREKGYRQFIHVLLANWLTAFWWLMPLKAVAGDMAENEGRPGDPEAIGRFYQNLRQITTRRTPPLPGAFFSAGWNGVFYSTSPPLIEWIENDGSPHLSAEWKRLLQNRAGP